MGWSAEPGPDASEEPRGLAHSGAPPCPQPMDQRLSGLTSSPRLTTRKAAHHSPGASSFLLNEEMKSLTKEDPRSYVQKLLKRIRLGKWARFKFQCVKHSTPPLPPLLN